MYAGVHHGLMLQESQISDREVLALLGPYATSHNTTNEIE
jgi:hypothetical protein